jgi:hypothetical protein
MDIPDWLHGCVTDMMKAYDMDRDEAYEAVIKNGLWRLDEYPSEFPEPPETPSASD